MSKLKRLAVALGAAIATVFAVAAFSAPVANAATHSFATATTTFTNVPDSGYYGGDWGVDNYKQTTTVTLVEQVADSNCPAGAVHCYLWEASVSDTGTTTTIGPDGVDSGKLPAGFDPNTGTVENEAVFSVNFSGGSPNVEFYANKSTVRASRVPTSENDNYNANPTNKRNPFPFVNRFFKQKGLLITPVADMSDGNWSFTYSGTDPQCTSAGTQTWTDAYNETAEAPSNGDIIAYSASTCPTDG
jgi:hypothetical protein